MIKTKIDKKNVNVQENSGIIYSGIFKLSRFYFSAPPYSGKVLCVASSSDAFYIVCSFREGFALNWIDLSLLCSVQWSL